MKVRPLGKRNVRSVWADLPPRLKVLFLFSYSYSHSHSRSHSLPLILTLAFLLFFCFLLFFLQANSRNASTPFGLYFPPCPSFTFPSLISLLSSYECISEWVLKSSNAACPLCKRAFTAVSCRVEGVIIEEPIQCTSYSASPAPGNENLECLDHSFCLVWPPFFFFGRVFFLTDIPGGNSPSYPGSRTKEG